MTKRNQGSWRWGVLVALLVAFTVVGARLRDLEREHVELECYIAQRFAYGDTIAAYYDARLDSLAAVGRRD